MKIGIKICETLSFSRTKYNQKSNVTIWYVSKVIRRGSCPRSCREKEECFILQFHHCSVKLHTETGAEKITGQLASVRHYDHTVIFSLVSHCFSTDVGLQTVGWSSPFVGLYVGRLKTRSLEVNLLGGHLDGFMTLFFVSTSHGQIRAMSEGKKWANLQGTRSNNRSYSSAKMFMHIFSYADM